MLAGHGDGGQHRDAAAMVGFFAIQDDEFVFGGGTPHARLNLQQLLVEFVPVQAPEEATESRLRGCRIASRRVAPNAQGPALALVEPAGEFFQVGLAAGRFTQHRQENQCGQTEQGIGFHPLTIFGQRFEIRYNLCDENVFCLEFPWAKAPRLPSRHRYAITTDCFRTAFSGCATNLRTLSASGGFQHGQHNGVQDWTSWR